MILKKIIWQGIAIISLILAVNRRQTSMKWKREFKDKLKFYIRYDVRSNQLEKDGLVNKWCLDRRLTLWQVMEDRSLLHSSLSKLFL